MYYPCNNRTLPIPMPPLLTNPYSFGHCDPRILMNECGEFDRYYNSSKFLHHQNSYELPTECNEIGQLIKLNASLNEKNSVLPLFGREIKNGIFRYHAIYKSNDEPFKIYVSKNNRANNCETSREIYDGDILHLDDPLNAKYRFKEVRNFY